MIVQRAHKGVRVVRLQTFRDDGRSRHFDLIGGKGHPWSIDLVTVTTASILILGFASAVAAMLVR
jgi:hypothetical protein